MRIIEKCWVDIKAGYQDARSLEKRLRSDWKRAIQVAQRRENLTGQAKHSQTRRNAGIIVIALLFICIVLWAGILFLPDLRGQFLSYLCLFAFPAIPVGLISIFYLLRDRAKTQTASHPPLGLVEQWWKSLRPKGYAVETPGEEAEVDFLKSLSFLDNNHIAVWGLLTSAKRTSDTDVLLLGPTGIWIFEVKFWPGMISKQRGIWYSEDKSGYRKARKQMPDEQWQAQKEEITKTIQMRLRSKLWLGDLINGGVVFANKEAKLGEITGHKVACGTPHAWRNRIKKTKRDRDFSVEDQLELLDALIRYANLHERQQLKIVSAREEAVQLYEKAVIALQKYVSERVK